MEKQSSTSEHAVRKSCLRLSVLHTLSSCIIWDNTHNSPCQRTLLWPSERWGSLIIQTSDGQLFAAEGWAPFGRKKSNIIAQWQGNSVVLQAAGLRSPWKPSSQGLTNYKSNSLTALRIGHWSPDTSLLQSQRNTQVSIPSVFLCKQSPFHTADISLCRFHHYIRFQ